MVQETETKFNLLRKGVPYFIRLYSQNVVCHISSSNVLNLPCSRMYTVVNYRVVSTRLTEEEHVMLLDVCNIMGCTPSHLIRDTVMRRINLEQKTIQKESNPLQSLFKKINERPQLEKKESVDNELTKLLGISVN